MFISALSVNSSDAVASAARSTLRSEQPVSLINPTARSAFEVANFAIQVCF
jgi:hypothetical protein